MIYNIEYAGPALRDLREAERYIRARSGDAVADRFILDIVAKMRNLRNTPTRQRLRAELAMGLRAVPVGTYLIFCRIENDTVRIVRVLHALAILPRNCFAAKERTTVLVP